MDDDFEDGNVLAGPLREIFAVDITSATGRCASCGRVDTVAGLRVYTEATGHAIENLQKVSREHPRERA